MVGNVYLYTILMGVSRVAAVKLTFRFSSTAGRGLASESLFVAQSEGLLRKARDNLERESKSHPCARLWQDRYIETGIWHSWAARLLAQAEQGGRGGEGVC